MMMHDPLMHDPFITIRSRPFRTDHGACGAVSCGADGGASCSGRGGCVCVGRTCVLMLLPMTQPCAIGMTCVTPSPESMTVPAGPHNPG